MSVRHVNELKENQTIIHFFSACPYLFGKYKYPAAIVGIKTKNLKEETNTVELLLSNLTYQPLLSFTVWKMVLNCEIKWNRMFGKVGLMFPSCFHYVNMNQNLFYFSFRYSLGLLEDITYFVLDGQKKRWHFICKH